MKRYLITIFVSLVGYSLQAQTNKDGVIPLGELAVPNSPSFILMDVAPSNIESPSTPKEFVLGLSQHFDKESKFFQDYSIQFTPYWWFKPKGRDVYSFMSLKKNPATKIYEQNVTGGLKFTNVSVAFLNKDVIQGTTGLNQKIVSLGARTTLIKIQHRNYAKILNETIDDWHVKALDELATFQDALFNVTDETEKQKLLEKQVNLKNTSSDKVAERIKELISEKPLFNWDVAGGMATYGIGDSVWKAGRYGAWTTLASFIPLDTARPHINYLDVLISARYLQDNYVVNDSNRIVKGNSLDIGGKLGFEINNFSLFGEAIFRKISEVDDWQKRITGILNYRVKKNIFITATYGTDFGPRKKIIALFGINWGFGNEKMVLPTATNL